MPDPESKKATVAARDASKPRLPGTLTEAGRIADKFSTLQRALALKAGAAARDAAPPARATDPHPAPAPKKPSKSRAREARQKAALGAHLIRDGRHAQAIEPLRRSVELDPTVAAAQHDLGLAYLIAGRLEEAAGALGSALSLSPDLASAHYNLGVVLDRLGREREAQSAYEAAVRLAPERHQAQTRLGQLYIARSRHAEAAAAFRAAAAATAGSVQGRIYAALAADIAGATAEAQAMLRAVIADDPVCGEAHGVLAQILAQHGQSADAAACFERAISLDPGMVAAWQGIATNRKFTAADQPLIGQMRACLERPDLTPVQRMAVLFALGKAHDDIGDYGTAMRHFDAANRIRAATAKFDRAGLVANTTRLIAAAPPGYLDRRRDLGVDDATPIVIVGMPRSGTTLVEQILSSHPDVAPGGELGFWGERSRAGAAVFDAAAKPEAVRRLADDYLAVLRAISPDAARVTDKMPFNFAVLGLIRQVFPRAAIVHCRRHPIDTCLSIFNTNFEASMDFAAERGSLVLFYRQYQRLMAHWRAVLPPDRFVEVDYEALVANPEPITRQLVAACGLDWSDACLAPQRNQRRIATASLWQARQPIYRTSVARWKRYEPWLGELRELLPAAAAEAAAAVAP